jgi:hypothetical protein
MAFRPWNYKQIKSMYPSAGNGFLDRVDGRINVHSPAVAIAIKEIVANEGGDMMLPPLSRELEK